MERLYVFATQEEYDNLRQYMPTNERVMIIGEGYGNVIKSLKDIDKNTLIFNIGYCGSNSIPIGTEVKVRKCYCYHPNFDSSIKYTDEVYSCDPLGDYDCYTAGDFVTETNIKTPCIFDMELYAIFSLGFRVVATKIVSDNLSLHDYREMAGMGEEGGVWNTQSTLMD